MKKVVILGSSGSIGTQTLDIVSRMKNAISVEGLSVYKNIETLKKQIKRFKPKAVSVQDPLDAENLKKWCVSQNIKIAVYNGHSGLRRLVEIPQAEMVISAVVGAAGLKPVIKAIECGKNIAMANKEALVMAGSEIMRLAAKKKVSVLPIDSEHSAIFQCCGREKKSQIKKIILTASGGPFYKYDKDFSKITVEQALDHPTWKMGRKITIDSATLMNKGLEAIEASVLFDIPIENIEIVIHPQSIIHSMVEYVDGSVIAQLSNPDMRLPIQYVLTYPERTKGNIKPLDLNKAGKLEFHDPDFQKFPCLALAYNAAKKGGTMPAVMSAANEVVVAAFLNKDIKFTDIPTIVAKTMKAHKIKKTHKIDDYVEADAWAKIYSKALINKNKER
ncbi:MAG: 1-deoxy-D-xylulose-5-phosphate reductoisomerase [Endomicrobium sp.]|jgi:1-deoxy-D-xylulose-5-phosphate reductoisomerase|nr:1-deoxy-D-xylulose-5-phosphate reductoisomerase [Endomicrobium sp.]